MKLSIYYRALLLFVVLFTAPLKKTEAQTTVIPGEIPVNYDVSPTGAFSYSVPLRIPPGIKSMIPNLAITYNSQGGNGILGMGWNLSGMSAITRGMPTIYHNQNIAPIDFNADDVFFLDGQRLFWESATSRYLTEVKNFTTIRSFGSAGNGPSYFTVEHPNGTVIEFGNSISSKMLAQGKSDVLMWAVNKIEDIHGNVILFEYSNQRISKITYGANSNTSSDIPIEINFIYDNRPDPNTFWVGGSELNSTVLLKDIVVNFTDIGNTQANKYHFTYDVNNLSRLVQIDELRNGNDVMEPIVINWSPNSADYDVTPTSAPASTGNTSLASGDYNGDGFSDVVAYDHTGNPNIEVFINDKTGDFNSAVPVNLSSTSGDYAAANSKIGSKLTFDYDGDGMDDILLINNHTLAYPFFRIHLLRANGTSSVFDAPQQIFFLENKNNQNSNFHTLTHFIPGDFDGDGKTELVMIAPYNFHNSNSVEDYEIYIIGDNYGPANTTKHGPNNHGHQIHHFGLGHIDGAMTVDYNGDGKDEILFTHILGGSQPTSYLYELKLTYNSSTLQPQLIQTQTQWPHTLLSTSSFPHTYLNNYFGDFNGDGKTDVISWQTNSPNNWLISYSDGDYPTYSNNGQSIVPQPLLANLDPASTANISHFAADFNGDGLCDFVQLKLIAFGEAECDIFYSTGTSFVHHHEPSVYIDSRYNSMCLGDFNGDGQIDLMNSRSLLTGSDFNYLSFQKNNKSLLVSSIEHVGKTLSIDYKPITQDPDYLPSLPINNNDYFLTRTFPAKVVKNLSDNITLDYKYKYKGLVLHKYGLGIRGYQEFIIENNVGQKTYQGFNLTARIPYLSEETTFDALGSDPFGTKTTYQQLDFPGGSNGNSRIIINYPATVKSYISSSETLTTISTGTTSAGTVFYDFGKIASTSVRTKDLAGGNNSLQTTTYNYGTNWATLKGKPESVTVYSDIDPTGANGITRTTEYAYYSNGDLQTVKTDPGTLNETITDYFYDYQSSIYPYGNVVRTDLNANGVPGTITNEYSYTTDGKFLASKVNPMLYTTTYNYGSLAACWGNVLSTTNYKGLQTQYTYDALNRVTKETDVYSGIETYTDYEWASSSPYANSLTTAHLVVKTTNSYDAAFGAKVLDLYGRTIRDVSIGFNGDIYTDYTYEDNGQVKTVKGPYESFNPMIAATTTYTYDAWGRETQRSTDNNGPVILTDYSVDQGTGMLHTTVTNQGANIWKKSITCGKTLWSVISSGTPNHTIDYSYYGNGTVASTIVNANAPGSSGGSKSFSQTVDPYGRVDGVSQPGVGPISYAYDALGRVVTETTATGTVYQYDYDVLGRVVQKHMLGTSQPYTYTYDNTNGTGSTGELTQETSPNGHVKDYTYHPEGWLHSLKEDNTFETVYTYNPNGDLYRYTFDNDIQIEYKYFHSGVFQEANLITGSNFAIPPGGQILWQGWGLNAHGQREGAYYYGATNPPAPIYADRRTYDNVHGILERHEVININQMATNVVDNYYSFDIHTGNLSSRTDAMPMRNHTEYFTYDNHYDRLSTVSQSLSSGPITQTLGIGYNEHGNITQKDDAAPVHPTYPNWRYDDYALKTVQLPSGPPFPPSVSIPQYKQEIVYTPFEKIERMREDLNNEVVFTYGADDQRVQATYTDLTAGAAGSLYKTKTYYHNYERIDYPSGGKDELFYVWAGHELVSILKIFSFPGQPTVSNIYYPVRDHLGSITHLMDIDWMAGPAGNGIVEERSFDAWGRTRDPNNWQPYPVGAHPATWITDRGYTGHEHIWQPTFANFYDNNIINMDGRLYDPLVGRMFSPDPYIPDGTNTQDYNKYLYARNNPLKYTDPTGNFAWAPIIMVAVFAGVVNMGNNEGNINNGWDRLGYFSIGFTAGFAGGTAGVGATAALGLGGGIAGGAVGGAAGGFASGSATGAGNAWIEGASFSEGWASGAKAGVYGGAAGAVSGGIMGGIQAIGDGTDLWTGESQLLGGPPGEHQDPITIDPKGDEFQNPTGQELRTTDPHGSGAYAAGRKGGRPHLGIDFKSTPGQDVVSPVDGTMTFAKGKYHRVDIYPKSSESGVSYIRMLYVEPKPEFKLGVSYNVTRGQAIGIAQSNLIAYPSATTMTNHVHLQLFHNQYRWINPTPYFFK